MPDGLRTQPPVLGADGIATTGTSEVPASEKSQDEWLARARLSWEQSTTWFDSSVRTQIRKNLSNWRSQHPEGSKYLHPSFRARSRTFRPKTRALGRRVEAAAAVALFATSDLVNISAWNQSDPNAVARAKLKQKVMQYRLEQDETTWFLTCIGAAQDAFVSGIVISHQYWKYTEVHDERYNIYRYDHQDGTSHFDMQKDTTTIITENRPCCDIVPIERFRFDPACDWRDPANTSPFIIHEAPTYVGEIKLLIEQGIYDALDPEKMDDGYWWAIASGDYDSIRAAREGARIDKYTDKKAIPDTQTINLRKHIHRVMGRDWYYETLGDIVMARMPQLLTDVYPHLQEGKRPYTTGMIVPETHKPYPSAPVQLIEPLQEEINDVSNLRQDTVKMSTFGRWEVRRASSVDVATLKAGVPQSVIAVDKVGQDIGELKQREVPNSAFMETDRLQVDLDDVSGGMTQATAASNKALNQDQTLGGMNLLEGQSGQIRELELRVFVKTWVEPVLQQWHDMVSTYESDENVLNDVAGNNGVDGKTVLDALKERSRVRVDVGFNATTPEKRIGRLSLALGTMFNLFPGMKNDANQYEIQKEIMGSVGFDDGERFFPNPDKLPPQVKALQQQVQQLTQMLMGKEMDYKNKIDVATIKATAAAEVATITGKVAYDIALIQYKIETNKGYLESIDAQLASAAHDLNTEELQLERTALAHTIESDEREFALKMHAALSGGANPKGAGAKRSSGPPVMRVPGGDKAGTLARDRYGAIPFQAG